jgi:hypothetical protein
VYACVGVCGYFIVQVSDCGAIGDGAFSAYIKTHYNGDPKHQAALGVRSGCDLNCGSFYTGHVPVRGCGASTQENIFSRFFVHYFRWHTINDDFNLPRQARDNTAVAAGV